MKKFLCVFLAAFMVFGVASPVFAAVGETWYEDAQTYIQIDSDSRLVIEHGGSVYNHSLYIVDHGDSLEFVIPSTLGSLFYVSHSDGTFSSSGLSGLTIEENKYGFRYAKSLTLSYPFSIGDVKFNSKADFIQKCERSKGVYSLPSDATLGAADSGGNFFPNPLLEQVKTLQKGTTTVPESLKASFLDLLIPLSIGCLALLTSLVVLRRVFGIFLH